MTGLIICSKCKRRKENFAKNMCRSCYISIKRHKKTCARCGKKVKIYALTDKGPMCLFCRMWYRYKLFLEGIVTEWGPGHKKCIVCDQNDLPYNSAGLCSGCVWARGKWGKRYCDRCGVLVYRNFCKNPIHLQKPERILKILCNNCARLFQFKWAFGYERCIDCGETDSPHAGEGSCHACVMSFKLWGWRTCWWCNRKTKRSFWKNSTNVVICSNKCKKEVIATIEKLYKKGIPIQEIAKQVPIFKACSSFSHLLREIGLYTRKFVVEGFGSIAVIRNTSFRYKDPYNTEEKQLIRELVAEETHKALHFPLQLISLSHVNMADIVEFANCCRIEPSRSLVVEKEHKWFNLISSWVNAATLLPDGHIIKGLQLYNGNLSQALIKVPSIYNCANFDFDGCLSKEVYISLQNLFRLQRLTDDAMVFITLADHIRFLSSPSTSKLITMPQGILVPLLMDGFAQQNGYHSEPLWKDGLRYKENTRSPMLTLAFRIRKVKEVNRHD
ncbi:MAG: hypothetical protein FJZ16_06655 [Candidatus Omnitrophica bacterium]|nr:hypothetical protein [Candidatus Omnitrophota bacterium]